MGSAERLLGFRRALVQLALGRHVDLPWGIVVAVAVDLLDVGLSGFVVLFLVRIHRLHLLLKATEHLPDPFAKGGELRRTEHQKDDGDENNDLDRAEHREHHAEEGSRLFTRLLAFQVAVRHPHQVRVSRTTDWLARAMKNLPIPPVVRPGRHGPQLHTRHRAAGNVLALVVAVATALSGAGPAGAADPKAKPKARMLSPGSLLWVSAAGRRRVRGGRADGASIHAAWIASESDAEAPGRAALAAFERATFSVDTGVVKITPDPWMTTLNRPTLPLRWTRRLVEYLNYFKDSSKGRGLMRGWLRRAPRYEATLRAILSAEGVPEDLVFVALAESGFNPTARSRVGAGGMWQFMEATGRVYGLSQDYWIDERYDVVRSTHAAALYLKDLHTRFGTWELALAAFNAGYGLVMVSIDRHNTNDFWRLADLESGLPFATTNYVPKIVAAAVVGANREAFGYDEAALDPLPAVDWVDVRVPAKTSLSSLAKKLGESESLIAEINGRYIRGRTPPRGTSTVRIPRNRKVAFEKAYPLLVKEAAALRETTVAHGERLAAIAERYGTTVKLLRRVNRVGDSAELTGGVVLVVPAAVHQEKTLAGGGESPEASQPLAAVPPLVARAGTRRVFFRTNRASLPRELSRAFDTPWAQIVAWNGLDPRARLQSGQVLQLVVDANFDARQRNVRIFETDEVELVTRGSRAHVEAGLARRKLERRAYRAKKGDTLTKIGRRFSLTVGDLARINGFPRSHAPSAGELVVVYIAKAKRGGTLRAPDPPSRGDRPPSTASTAAVPTPPAPNSRAASTADTARVPGTTSTR